MKDGFDKVTGRIDSRENKVQDLQTVMRGYGKQSIAEIYKTNITVANFADF